MNNLRSLSATSSARRSAPYKVEVNIRPFVPITNFSSNSSDSTKQIDATMHTVEWVGNEAGFSTVKIVPSNNKNETEEEQTKDGTSTAGKKATVRMSSKEIDAMVSEDFHKNQEGKVFSSWSGRIMTETEKHFRDLREKEWLDARDMEVENVQYDSDSGDGAENSSDEVENGNSDDVEGEGESSTEKIADHVNAQNKKFESDSEDENLESECESEDEDIIKREDVSGSEASESGQEELDEADDDELEKEEEVTQTKSEDAENTSRYEIFDTKNDRIYVRRPSKANTIVPPVFNHPEYLRRIGKLPNIRVPLKKPLKSDVIVYVHNNAGKNSFRKIKKKNQQQQVQRNNKHYRKKLKKQANFRKKQMNHRIGNLINRQKRAQYICTRVDELRAKFPNSTVRKVNDKYACSAVYVYITELCDAQRALVWILNELELQEDFLNSMWVADKGGQNSKAGGEYIAKKKKIAFSLIEDNISTDPVSKKITSSRASLLQLCTGVRFSPIYIFDALQIGNQLFDDFDMRKICAEIKNENSIYSISNSTEGFAKKYKQLKLNANSYPKKFGLKTLLEDKDIHKIMCDVRSIAATLQTENFNIRMSGLYDLQVLYGFRFQKHTDVTLKTLADMYQVFFNSTIHKGQGSDPSLFIKCGHKQPDLTEFVQCAKFLKLNCPNRASFANFEQQWSERPLPEKLAVPSNPQSRFSQHLSYAAGTVVHLMELYEEWGTEKGNQLFVDDLRANTLESDLERIVPSISQSRADYARRDGVVKGDMVRNFQAPPIFLEHLCIPGTGDKVNKDTLQQYKPNAKRFKVDNSLKTASASSSSMVYEDPNGRETQNKNIKSTQNFISDEASNVLRNSANKYSGNNVKAQDSRQADKGNNLGKSDTLNQKEAAFGEERNGKKNIFGTHTRK